MACARRVVAAGRSQTNVTATLKRNALNCRSGSVVMLLMALMMAVVAIATGAIATANATAESESVRAFASHLRERQLPHGLIVDARAATLAASAAARAALSELLTQRRVRVIAPAQLQHILSAEEGRRMGRMGALLLTNRHDDERLCANTPRLFEDGRLAWIVVVMAPGVKRWTQLAFADCNVGVDADITLAERVISNGTTAAWYRLYDVYSVCQACGRPLMVRAKGRWLMQRDVWQLDAAYRGSAVRRRGNFTGHTMNSATAIIEKPPGMNNLAYLTNELDHKQLDTMQRKTYQLLATLETMWHVRFTVQFMDVWGTRNASGNWTGVIGAIVGGQADFSMCPLRYTRQRIADVQYAPDLHVEVIPFIFRHPRRNAIRNIFFEPLTTRVWWCVGALIAGAALLLAVQTRLAGISGEQRSWHYTLLVLVEAFCLQGPAPDTYQRTSMRALLLWLCVFSCLLAQFYGGYIVGSLLAVLPRSITTLAALYNSSLTLGMERVSYNFEIFENASSRYVQLLYAQRICQPPLGEHITSIERGAERIKRGGYAFHVSANRMLYLLKSQLSDDEFCDLQLINLAPPYQASIALRKRSPYREHFATAIVQLRTAGLMQRNDARWRVPATDCRLQQQNREVVVDLEHFVPALIFLAMANACAGCALLLELALQRWRRYW